jgi:hypothetical protein
VNKTTHRERFIRSGTLRLVLTAAAAFLLYAGVAGAEVAIWAEGSTAKIGPEELPPAETVVWDGERITIKAARGEWESFQVVINSDASRLVSFQIFDLEGARGKVPGANVSIFRELYLPVDWPSVDPQTDFTVGLGRGRWPDPLVPVVGHAEVAAGENTVFWFDVQVPEETLAGKYEGEVRVKWSGGERALPLDLAVWDFALELDGPAPFEAAVDAAEVSRLFDLKKDDADAAAIVAAYSRLLEEHYVATREAGDITADEHLISFAEAEVDPGAVMGIKEKGDRVGLENNTGAGFIDRPAGDHRLLGWALWRFGGDFAYVGDASYFPRKDARPLSDDPRNEYGNGFGVLVYPGKELGYDNPIPNIRLKLLREAAEDYAFLSALAADGYAAYAAELAAGVVPAMPRGRGAIDAAAMYEGREAAALATVKGRWGQGIAENEVGGRAVSDEGVPVAGAVVRVGPLAAVTGREGDYALGYVPRGRALTAEAPGYERAGSAGAGGRGDFYMKQILRRYILNDGGPAEDYDARGFERGGVAPEGNPVGGPVFVGRLKDRGTGRFGFRAALRDWRTFGAFAVELYNGSEGLARARVRFEDDAGAFYEDVFPLAPRRWTAARVELGDAAERYYLKTSGSGDNLRFEAKPKLDLSLVKNVEITFEAPAACEVRVGRAWLEARKE